MNTHRERRVNDFKRRVAASPDLVRCHRTRGWSYIPVHNFADEANRQAQRVDCWCLLDDDGALLECEAFSSSALGLYARVDAEAPHWPKLRAVMDVPLTRIAVEKAMESFVALGFPEALLSQLHPGGPLVRLET